MTITFRPIPKPTKLKADTYALKQARIHTHKQLENELAEEEWDRRLRRNVPLGLRD